MTRKDIQPESLPDPRPRYTHGVLAEGRLLFIAGQVAVDNANAIVGKGDPEKQAEQTFENLKAVLAAAGASFDNLVMTTTYLTDITYRDAFNKVRVKYYASAPPTNTLVVVKGLANPDYLIEIAGIAVL
jgi:2-iminobutanoate/2-iminopropanoate deaminase